MRQQKDINWMELIIGVVCILIGIYTFARPHQALNGFAVAYGILAIIMGIADIAFYVHMERHTGFGPVVEMITGILNIFIGFFLIVCSDVSVLAASVFFPIWNHKQAHQPHHMVNSQSTGTTHIRAQNFQKGFISTLL